MNSFRRKQKKFRKTRNIIIVLIALIFFVYIGVEPYLQKAGASINAMHISLFVIVLAGLVVEFIYETKYAKADKFLSDIELQINDAGYYISSREENDIKSYYIAVRDDLAENGYKISENTEVDGLDFDLCATKGRDYFYIVNLDSVDRNDVIAYLDAARNDVVRNKLKRKGEAVVLFITDDARESAIELSKSVSRIVMSRYNSIYVSPAIVEIESKKVYFLGNRISSTQKMVVNFVMNCDFPLKDKYKNKEKLPFQKKLKEDMKDFNYKDFKDGKYNER